MSIQFDWSKICDNQQFLEQLKTKINHALQLSNNDNLSITLESIDLGSQAPQLRLIKLGELKNEKVELICGFDYRGNASMCFKVHLELNPLATHNPITQKAHRKFLHVLSADSSLHISIDTTLSQFRINGAVEIVYHQDCESIDLSKRISEVDDNDEISDNSNRLEQVKKWINGKKLEFKRSEEPKVLKKTQNEPHVTIRLLELVHDLHIQNSFEGSPASDLFSESCKKRIQESIGQLVDVPFSFPPQSTTSGNELTVSPQKLQSQKKFYPVMVILASIAAIFFSGN